MPSFSIAECPYDYKEIPNQECKTTGQILEIVEIIEKYFPNQDISAFHPENCGKKGEYISRNPDIYNDNRRPIEYEHAKNMVISSIVEQCLMVNMEQHL